MSRICRKNIILFNYRDVHSISVVVVFTDSLELAIMKLPQVHHVPLLYALETTIVLRAFQHLTIQHVTKNIAIKKFCLLAQ